MLKLHETSLREKNLKMPRLTGSKLSNVYVKTKNKSSVMPKYFVLLKLCFNITMNFIIYFTMYLIVSFTFGYMNITTSYTFFSSLLTRHKS